MNLKELKEIVKRRSKLYQNPGDRKQEAPDALNIDLAHFFIIEDVPHLIDAARELVIIKESTEQNK